MIRELFTKFGLTKNESLLYSTLLTIGESKVHTLVQRASFKSGKVYTVLNSLLTKGLIAVTIKNNVRYYSPQPPRKIKEIIVEKERELSKQKKLLEKELPQLEHLFTTKKDSCTIKTYQGIEGIRTALLILINKTPVRSTILLQGANDDPKRDIILQWPTYEEQMSQKEVQTKVIFSHITGRGRKQRTHYNNETYRYLEGTDTSNFMQAGILTILFNFEEPSCIVIESKRYAQQFKEIFNVFWKHAEKI